MFEARWGFILSQDPNVSLPSWYDLVRQIRDRSSDLLSMLERARRLDASDPRDKVYALLGISTGIDTRHQHLEIDYDKPIPELYRNVAIYMLDAALNYDIFGHVSESRTTTIEPISLQLRLSILGRALRRPATLNIAKHYIFTKNQSCNYCPSWIPQWNSES
jgi:hypothetical protein